MNLNQSNPDLQNIKLYFQDSDVKGKPETGENGGGNNEEPAICRIFADSEPNTSLTSSVETASNFFFMMPSDRSNSEEQDELNISPESTIPVSIGSEADRRKDAWIPNPSTRQALITTAISAPGTYFPERELLTMPGLILDEELNDMLHEVVSMYIGETEAAQRNVLSAKDVTQDERGVRELIETGSYRAAINLTGRLLTMHGQGLGKMGHPSKNTPHTLQLWFTRLALLVKIKMFKQAEQEAESFGNLDRPDLFYQFYPDKFGGRPGSFVPFAFRVLLAELPLYCDKAREAYERLFKILAVVRHVIKNLNEELAEDGSPIELNETDRRESLTLWTNRLLRVQHSIVNCALQQRNYSMALQLLQQIATNPQLTNNQQANLASVTGRVHLQLGDVIGADRYFTEAQKLTTGPTVRDIVDRSLLALSQNNFSEAYRLLVEANGYDSTNVMILNNMGVCLLYLGQMKESISLLENAITANPSRGLHDALLLNICTLYELESSHSRNKKLMLLRQLARYKADVGENVQHCLKLSMNK